MKIYLETSVPNFLFAEDAPEKRDATREFWHWLRMGTEEVFVSQLVFSEINDAPDTMKARLKAVLDEIHPAVLDLDEPVVNLANLFMRRGIVPMKYSDDALHVAVAVVNEMDVLASWNLRHIVKLKTITAVNQVCLEYGLKPIRIHTPQEILP